MRILEPEIAELALPQRDRFADPMLVPASQIRRYDYPQENTLFPLEYAFHLLGDLVDKTVVDLSCGEGLTTVILAKLGARVVAVSASEQHLDTTARRASVNGVSARVELLHWQGGAIPVGDGRAHHVICNGVFTPANSLVTARQLRRVLKPGGTAVIEAAMALPGPLGAITNRNVDDEGKSSVAGQALGRVDVEAACRAVGAAGRRREFWLVTRLLSRNSGNSQGVASDTVKWAQRLDARVLRRFQFARRFAASLVWEARKES
jgi:SAM-dependent methyltransferase